MAARHRRFHHVLDAAHRGASPDALDLRHRTSPGGSSHVRAAIPHVEAQPVVKRAYEAALVAAPGPR